MAAIRVILSAPLDGFAGRIVEVRTLGSVGRVIEALCRQVCELRTRLKDESGKLHPFVYVYLNGEDIRHLKGTETRVRDGDEILIVPAIAGG